MSVKTGAGAGFGAGVGVVIGILVGVILLFMGGVAMFGGCTYLVARSADQAMREQQARDSARREAEAKQIQEIKTRTEPSAPTLVNVRRTDRGPSTKPGTEQVREQPEDGPTIFDEPKREPVPDTSPLVVWGGDGFSMYHAPGCDRAPKGKKTQEIRRSHAKERGFTQCKICKPDELPDENP